MRKRVLIVPDKFKGTLTAQGAAAAIAQGWRTARPEDDLNLLPMSDGGDGFGEVMADLLRLEPKCTQTVDAAHRPWQATWWQGTEERIAVLESARVIGLALLPPQKYHPFQLDTFGLGPVLRAAAASASSRHLIGIGGSATNDGGFGLARAVGWRFRNETGEEILRWTELVSLAQIVPPKPWPFPSEAAVAVDVQNRLLGPAGCSRVYGPQKGLEPEDFSLAEACLERLAAVAREQFGFDAAVEPGSGAAGGLGFGLRAFFRARLESGFQLFAAYARLEQRIREADVVITGEGAIDRSTMMGKGVGEVAQLCRKQGVPCLGLAGTLALDPEAGDCPEPFTQLHGIVPILASDEQARAGAEFWLARLAAVVGGRLHMGI